MKGFTEYSLMQTINFDYLTNNFRTKEIGLKDI